MAEVNNLHDEACGFPGLEEAWLINPEELPTMAQSENPEDRARAALAMGVTNPQKFLDTLLELSRDSDEQVRINAVESLGVIPGDVSGDRLLELTLNGESRLVRAKAFAALSSRNSPES